MQSTHEHMPKPYINSQFITGPVDEGIVRVLSWELESERLQARTEKFVKKLA